MTDGGWLPSGRCYELVQFVASEMDPMISFILFHGFHLRIESRVRWLFVSTASRSGVDARQGGCGSWLQNIAVSL